MTATLSSLAVPGVPGSAEELWRRLDQGFLADAGWDPRTQTLAPAADHPLLGFRPCSVRGCEGQGWLSGGLCATCHQVYQRTELGIEEFIAVGPVRNKHYGEAICQVGGCPRPARNNRLVFCNTHDNHRKRLGLSATRFVEHPEARPLPGFGPCRVAVCERQAHCRRGLCRAHDVRWWQ